MLLPGTSGKIIPGINPEKAAVMRLEEFMAIVAQITGTAGFSAEEKARYIADAKNKYERSRNNVEQVESKCTAVHTTLPGRPSSGRSVALPTFDDGDRESIRGQGREGKIRTPFERADIHYVFDYQVIEALQNKYGPTESIPYIIMYVNRTFAMVKMSGQPWIFEKQTRVVEVEGKASHRVTEYSPYSVDGFCKHMDKYKITYTKKKPVYRQGRYVGDDEVPVEASIAQYWLKSPMQLEFDYMGTKVLRPGQTIDPRLFNLYSPPSDDDMKMPLSATDRVVVKPLVEWVWQDFTGKREHDFRYLMAWIATAVITPWKKIGTAPVLAGPQGTGKTTFVHKIGSLLDPYFVEFSSDTQVAGEFNRALMGKLLCSLNEAIFSGDAKTANKMKSLITEERIFINPKGKEGFTTDCPTNFIYCSNGRDPVAIETTNRRFAVFRMSGRFAGPATAESKAFFELIRAIPRDALRRYLYAITQQQWYKEFNLRQLPVTDAARDIKITQLESMPAFIHHWTTEGTLEQPEAEYEMQSDLDNPLSITSSFALRPSTKNGRLTFPESADAGSDRNSMPYKRAVYDAYCDWFRRSRFRFKTLDDEQRFWRLWREMFAPFIQGIGGATQAFFRPGARGPRPEKVWLPPLAEARDCFCQFINDPEYRFPDEEPAPESKESCPLLLIQEAINEAVTALGAVLPREPLGRQFTDKVSIIRYIMSRW